MKPLRLLFAVVLLLMTRIGFGQTTPAATNRPSATPSATHQPALATDGLHGKALGRHDFLYAGEAKQERLFIVRGGAVVWSYTHPGQGEISDATMLSNGNIIFCGKIGASEITPDKKIVWNREAPEGTEIHSIQPIGLDRVLVTQNGNPAKLMLVNTKTGEKEKEFTFPVLNPCANPHIQFRRVHETKEGTFLAAHLRDNRVVEYDANLREIWSYATSYPWWATRLKNGNTLITEGDHTVLEVNKPGEIVWQFCRQDAPEYRFFIFREACRLENGDTAICNWCPHDLKDPKLWPGSVQALEVTPEKKVVWALSHWKNPDLGPASSIRFLDEPGVPENPGGQQRLIFEMAATATVPIVGTAQISLRWPCALLAGAAIVLSYLDRQTLPRTLSHVQADSPFSDQIKALFDSAFLITYGLMYLGGGLLLDSLGAKRGFLLVMIFWSVASASHGLAGNDGLAPVFGMSFALVMLVASRCLLGMGEGGGFPAATRVVAEWFPANERASAMGLINAGAAVGAVVAPWLIWLVLNHTGWFGLAFFGQQTWSTLVVILPTDLISKRAVGALAGLVGFGGAMGGVLPGQTIGWMRDHGYSYTPALVLSGSMLVAAFILIRDYPLTASNCVRPRGVRARGLQTRCRPGPLTRRLPMRIRYLPSRDNPVLICLVMPKNQPLNCFANQ